MSLGADVTLHVAVQASERVRAMVLEMPVLEHAAPAAAFLFAPLLVSAHYAAPVLRLVSTALRRLPRDHLGVLGPGDRACSSSHPDEIAAILHGVLVGPVAPTAEERRQLTMPALIIGHRADRLHTFADAARLAKQLPNARLVEAGSPGSSCGSPPASDGRDRRLPEASGVRGPPTPTTLSPEALGGRLRRSTFRPWPGRRFSSQTAAPWPPGRVWWPALGGHWLRAPRPAGRPTAPGPVDGCGPGSARRRAPARATGPSRLEQPGPLARTELGRRRDVEPDVDPAGRPVGVLAPRAA